MLSVNRLIILRKTSKNKCGVQVGIHNLVVFLISVGGVFLKMAANKTWSEPLVQVTL